MEAVRVHSQRWFITKGLNMKISYSKAQIVLMWVLIAMMLGCVFGCAKKPTETIVDEHITHVDEALNYAKHNFVQTTEIKYLENELESCRTGLIACGASCESEIATCDAKVNYWRLSSTSLLAALIVAIYFLIKRK